MHQTAEQHARTCLMQYFSLCLQIPQSPRVIKTNNLKSEGDSYQLLHDDKVCLTMLYRGTCLKDGRPVERLSGSDLQAQPAECHYTARKKCYFFV